jgi:hypothetical protein
MKKILFVSLSLLMLVVSVLPAAQVSAAQVQYYPAQLEYIDAQVNLMLPRLDDFQAEYYAVNGRYYQALQSHTTAPDVPTVPDAIDQSPTDQPEDLALFWDGFAELPDQLGWSFRIDTYASPDGDGYVLTVETVIDYQTWTRSVNHGPASEDWRAAEWYQVQQLDF